MRASAWGFLIVAAACSYNDPSLDEARFKCDTVHTCPGDLTCLGGLCQRSAATHDGIACGVAGTCAAGQQCCIDTSNPPRCISAAEECPGTGAFCDSAVDCDAASRCCEFTLDVACGDPGCLSVVCQTNADCPSDEPNCCPSTGDEPWGTCNYFTCS